MAISRTGVQHANLLDNLSTSVVCVDSGLAIIYLNSAAENLLAASAAKVRHQNLLDVIEIPDSLLSHMHEALLSEQPYSDRQVALTLLNGDIIIVDCSITPNRLDSEPAQPVSLLLEINNIDRQLRIAREESIVSQQEQTKSLLRGLAHEIKNPLGGLRGAAQLLEKELPEASLKEYTSIIIRESDRLQQLIDRMLGPVNRPQLAIINIHEALEHVRRIVTVEAPPGVSIQTDYDPSIPEFNSDLDRLIQVILNIAVNALQAVGTDGKIILRSRIQSNFTIGSQSYKHVIAVQVVDNGSGITPELREHIFFPLVTGRSDGTGLGLSIAQTTINQLGGLIECHSEPEQTIFTVYIPIKPTLATPTNRTDRRD